MIDKAMAVGVTALAAALPSAVVASRPTVWRVLGHDFEAGSMIAALLACMAVRFYMGTRDPAYRWVLDAPVSALALMFTAALVADGRPAPLFALVTGTGVGAVGAGLIRFAERWVDRMLVGAAMPPDAGK